MRKNFFKREISGSCEWKISIGGSSSLADHQRQKLNEQQIKDEKMNDHESSKSISRLVESHKSKVNDSLYFPIDFNIFTAGKRESRQWGSTNYLSKSNRMAVVSSRLISLLNECLCVLCEKEDK